MALILSAEFTKTLPSDCFLAILPTEKIGKYFYLLHKSLQNFFCVLERKSAKMNSAKYLLLLFTMILILLFQLYVYYYFYREKKRKK